jgi:protein-L-isoaspartate(D-aspartate) O-methyltransferase
MLRKWATAAMLAAVCALVLAGCAPAASPTPVPSPTETPPEPVETESGEDDFAAERARLIETGIVGMGIEDPAAIAAISDVPRHAFVPSDFVGQAYENHPLPIGYGQTISQPYIVALMTEALELEPSDTVLEIGTGSGYQAAVLAEIVEQVYTVEIVEALADRAAETLSSLGYTNVEVRHADGYFGWEEHAPFDAIIVTAAPDHVPPPLRTQLADGARMVIPVGPVGGYQELWLIERHGDEFTTTSLGGVRFVPLTRDVRAE